MKPCKYQRSKQRCQPFFFLLVPQYRVSNYCVLHPGKAKKKNKNMQELCQVSKPFLSIKYGQPQGLKDDVQSILRSLNILVFKKISSHSMEYESVLFVKAFYLTFEINFPNSCIDLIVQLHNCFIQ